jgi:hypothetical protein
VNVKLNKLKAPLSALEAPKELTKPIKPTIKCSQGYPQKYPINKNPAIENYITSTGISISSTGISTSSTGISIRQSLHTDISVLVQEALFTDL